MSPDAILQGQTACAKHIVATYPIPAPEEMDAQLAELDLLHSLPYVSAYSSLVAE